MDAARLSLAAGILLGLIFSSGSAEAAGSCGTSGVLGDQVEVSFDGSLYYVTTPPGYTGDTPIPLIVGLHGDEGDPANSVNWFWRDVPDGSFLFVAPKAPNASGSWYEEQESNEAWMDALYASLRSLYNIDLDRQYIWGLSGGAVFSSRYVAARQDVIAAAQFNMGGSGTWNYVPPPTPECKIPARWAVSDTDFLVDGARDYFDLLTENGHETEWITANCEGHCWDEEPMEGGARDWLLAHTLCGRTPTPQCDGDPPPPEPEPEPTDPGPGSGGGGTTPDPTGNGTGGTVGDGSGSGGSSTGDPNADGDGGPMKGAVADEAGGCTMSPSKNDTNWLLYAGLLLIAWRGRRRTQVAQR